MDKVIENILLMSGTLYIPHSLYNDLTFNCFAAIQKKKDFFFSPL